MAGETTETIVTAGAGTTEAGAAGTKTEASADAGGTSKETSTDKAADAGKTTDTSKPAGAPEKYEDFKFPEGATVDAAAVTEFTALAKEVGLTQEAAQRLVDLQAKFAKGEAEKLTKHWEGVHKDWTDKVKADKDIGGDKLPESLALAKKALGSKYATPELIEALNVTGAGNHPAVVKFLVNLGKEIGDDKAVTGGKPSGGAAKTLADRIFPT